MAHTQVQIDAMKELILAIGQCIRELREVPSGHLYARLMGKINIETYQAIIQILINARVIEVSKGHVIKWTGPN